MNTVEPTAAATCPQCGHLNPRAARACDCGYDFVSQTKSLTFFPVATRKLIVLSICTFSIYELYWFYQNWKRIRAYAPHETFSPFWRAFFGVIWAIPLLQRMEEQAGAVGVAGTGSAVVLGVCYILLTISWRLPDPWWLVTFASCLPLIPVQRMCQRVNDAAQNPEGFNNRYSAANIVAVVLGGLVLTLSVIGTFLPPE